VPIEQIKEMSSTMFDYLAAATMFSSTLASGSGLAWLLRRSESLPIQWGRFFPTKACREL
jgi:hypothetical protein